MEPRCSVCGRSMRNDTFSGNLVCQRCGNEFGITDEISEGTYEEARAHVRNLRFDQAIKILNGLDKAESNVMLLNLLCCYQAEDTGVLADKVSKSPEKVKLLLMRKDVNLMAQSDDSRVKDYISHVLEYCFVELALAGVDISDLREKLNAQNTPVRKKPVQKQMSAFAKMDAEENAAAERSRMIREAANPKEKYLDDYVNDFMNTNPSRLDESLWKKPAGTLAGNIALDIIDLLLETVIRNEAPDIDISHGRVTEDEGGGRYRIIVRDRIFLIVGMESQFTGIASSGYFRTKGLQVLLVDIVQFVTRLVVIIILIILFR